MRNAKRKYLTKVLCSCKMFKFLIFVTPFSVFAVKISHLIIYYYACLSIWSSTSSYAYNKPNDRCAYCMDR